MEKPLFADKDLKFGSITFGVKNLGDAKSASHAAQIIMTNMFYQTFDADRVWTNDEWKDAIREAANHWLGFNAILNAARDDWRNDDFADAVIAIRDAGGSMKD